MSVLQRQASSTTSPRPATKPARKFLPSPQTHTPRARSRSSAQVWELLTPAHWASPVLQVPVQHLPPILLPLVLRLYLQAHQYPSLKPPNHPLNPSMKMKSCELFALVSLRTLCTSRPRKMFGHRPVFAARANISKYPPECLLAPTIKFSAYKSDNRSLCLSH
jgi:hypothetical protein